MEVCEIPPKDNYRADVVRRFHEYKIFRHFVLYLRLYYILEPEKRLRYQTVVSIGKPRRTFLPFVKKTTLRLE